MLPGSLPRKVKQGYAETTKQGLWDPQAALREKCFETKHGKADSDEESTSSSTSSSSSSSSSSRPAPASPDPAPASPDWKDVEIQRLENLNDDLQEQLNSANGLAKGLLEENATLRKHLEALAESD